MSNVLNYCIMVKQKMISVKLDIDQLECLDQLCSELGCNRNKMINFAVKMLNSNLNSYRQCSLIAAYQKALLEIK